MRKMRFIAIVIFLILVLTSLLIRVFSGDIPDVFNGYNDFEIYMSSQKEVNTIELIKGTDYDKLNVYLNEEDLTVPEVDKAIDNYFLSPNIVGDVIGKYIVVNFYFKNDIIRKDVSKEVVSSKEIIWTITIE